jgi:hypothetical protein
MALDDVVKNGFNGLSTDPNLGQKVYNAIISSITDALLVAAKQIDTQLDPKVNKSLKYTIEGFSINSIKDNIDPSQLYKDMINIYRQNIFGNNQLSNIYLLSALYIRALKKLGSPDPITGRREYIGITRQERENAQNIANITRDLLAESLYQYYKSIGKNVTMSEIMANIDKYASAFYGAYMGVINQIGSYILSKTPNISLLESSTSLMSMLNEMFISSIEGLISTMYSKLSIPEAISQILNGLGKVRFYNNIFEEISWKIGYYIGQGLQQFQQQNQPAGQQQGQPGNQLNAQQQNQQNQLVQVPSPQVIRPQNQQNNQQGP